MNYNLHQNIKNTHCQELDKELLVLDNVRITKHVYENLLLRQGWDKDEALYELNRREFRRLSRFDDLVKQKPYLVHKFDNYPNSLYYVNERLNLILVITDDNLHEGGEAIVTCLYISDYTKERYNLAA